MVEGARLESVLGETLRRFESCSLRFETERWHTRNGIGGSNPLPSAKKVMIET